METAFASDDLFERYPELSFLLTYTSFEKGESFCPQETDIQKPDLDGVDILYVYGLSGIHYDIFSSWLNEKKDRRLIFLEDELFQIQELLQSEHRFLFLNPQVVVHFLSSGKSINAHLEEIVSSYPCDRIDVIATASYQKRKKKRFHQLKLKLLRQSAVAHAILTESLYAHKLRVNLLRNIKCWHGSFFAGGLKGKFKGIPAVICGAGPSLQASIPLLKTLEDKVLIIAGGSTIAALSNQGVQPHLGIALDPNPEEFGRLKIASAYEMPLIYATRLQPDVFNAINGEKLYLISETGGPLEHHFEKQMGIEGDPVGPELGQEAFSVTTLAVAMAVEMGCNPILLDGVDLAYTGMQRYAEGILPSSQVKTAQLRLQKKAADRMLKRQNIHGHYVQTLVKWVMESECIASYAKAHSGTRFINVSQGGIGFPGIPNVSLSSAMESELSQSLDLRAFVHAQIQQLKMPPLKEKIEEELRLIEESLHRLKRIAVEMIEELERVQNLPSIHSLPTGKMTILEIDFCEEKAFECLFPLLGPALDKLLSRSFFISPNSSEEEKNRVLIQSKIAKWKQWDEMIDSEISVFRSIDRKNGSVNANFYLGLAEMKPDESLINPSC